jgi:DNA-binding response OmpR family regulator
MSALAGLSILVVEDEFMIALDAQEMLLALGAGNVEIVGTFDRAKPTVEEGKFDVVVLDVNLDGQLSFPLAEILKRRGIPVVFASGYDLNERPMPGFTGGVCVGKPYTSDGLERALTTVLSGAPAPAV